MKLKTSNLKSIALQRLKSNLHLLNITTTNLHLINMKFPNILLLDLPMKNIVCFL